MDFQYLIQHNSKKYLESFVKFYYTFSAQYVKKYLFVYGRLHFLSTIT